MIVVKIYKKGMEALPFTNKCKTKEEAEEWVKNHKSKGRDDYTINSATKIDGAKVLEQTIDFMGNEVYTLEFPAEYTVEYIDEHMHDRDNKMESLIKRRDQILCATDWLFMSDVKIDQKHRKMYLTYRQILRDLPQRIGQIDNIHLEEFDHWLRRNHPEEFMDGGKSKVILHRFYYYVK